MKYTLPERITAQIFLSANKLAGVEGVEPSHTAPEAAVLPLDDTPVFPNFSAIKVNGNKPSLAAE